MRSGSARPRRKGPSGALEHARLARVLNGERLDRGKQTMRQSGIDDIRRPVALVRIGSAQRYLLVGQELRIGRDPRCDFVVDEPRVSRVHASIRSDAWGMVTVHDLGSANGTFVGQDRIGTRQLTGNETIALGAVDGISVGVLVNQGRRPATGVLAVDAPVAERTVLVAADHTQRGHDVTVGRAPDNSIVLDDPLVSRHHARLVPVAGGYRIIDLQSLNGIQLNGRSAQAGELFGAADRLTIGRTILQVIDGEIVSVVDRGPALVASSLTFALKGGRTLLQDVSFSVPVGGLVAVIGPSGAGKSTLLRALTGAQPATSGQLVYQGLDLYRNFASLRQLIGVVPQDDVVHRQLTVRQALDYAAELRLPGDYDRAGRDGEVDRVIHDLGLAEHQHTTISRLSGGQRKRTSVAMELLTQPPLLLLDEPTSGLDPGLDLDVMRLLRAQADAGRTVLVVTHSTDNLALCDQVLILAPGGRVAYFGPPGQVLAHFGTDHYAEVFKMLADRPALFTERWASSHPPPDRPLQSGGPQQVLLPARPTLRRRRQGDTLIRRQLRIIAADRSYALATLLLPLVIAAMTLVIPGDTGFGQPPPDGLGEPSQLLVILTVGAAFMGMSASIRELVAERPIFQRERAVGLSPAIYLAAKVCVLFAMTLAQSAVLIAVVRVRKPGPTGAVWAPDGTLELWLAVFGTAFASALLGLMLSALVTTGEQTMPALVVTVMAQLVFCGGLITITDRGPLELVAALSPSRWGFAMSASTVDLRALNPTVAQDALWEHTTAAWLTSAGALAAIGLACLVLTAVTLRRRSSPS